MIIAPIPAREASPGFSFGPPLLKSELCACVQHLLIIWTQCLKLGKTFAVCQVFDSLNSALTLINQYHQYGNCPLIAEAAAGYKHLPVHYYHYSLIKYKSFPKICIIHRRSKFWHHLSPAHIHPYAHEKSEMLRKMSNCDLSPDRWQMAGWGSDGDPTDMQEIQLIRIHSFLYSSAELNLRFWAESCVSVTSFWKIFYNSRDSKMSDGGTSGRKLCKGWFFSVSPLLKNEALVFSRQSVKSDTKVRVLQ